MGGNPLAEGFSATAREATSWAESCDHGSCWCCLSGQSLPIWPAERLWLYQRGWLLWAGLAWFAAGISFRGWPALDEVTKDLLPPIDWNAPRTFAQIDRDAWKLVEAEAEQGDTVSLQTLTEFDVYMNTGRRLARTLANHYHPLSTAPIDNVPIVDLLTALELASEDLSALCRQVPGGDMLTPSHWKKAVQVAGYFQRANDIYSYLLPIFSPLSGLVRLGTQQLMVKPAWKDMQQNLLRWFFRAYVNRLGVHLIELYSGRLADRRGAISAAHSPWTDSAQGCRRNGTARAHRRRWRTRSGQIPPPRAHRTDQNRRRPIVEGEVVGHGSG